MAKNQSFDEHNLVPKTTTKSATTFSQLLFDDHDHNYDVDDDDDHHQIFNYSVSGSSSSSFAIQNPPKMLCFGSEELGEEPQRLVFKSSFTCSDSPSVSLDSKLKRRNGLNSEMATIKEDYSSNQKALKKNKADAPCSGHAKRKEKLGERITALQQLVSPFGKTDTASVLHEAMGYIKFLHEQVQVLCNPYLQQNNLHYSQSATGKKEKGEIQKEMDLKSRGLCLIPVDWSLHLANCTVADFWSPAMAMGKKL